MELILCSIYVPFNENISDSLNNLQVLLSKNANGNTIIAGDFNSSHVLWGAESTNSRGEEVLEFLIANNLFVINSPDSPPTFKNNNRSGWIDLTIVSYKIFQRQHHWSVSTALTLSDHLYILFELKDEQVELFKSDQYNLKTADWSKLKTLFSKRLSKYQLIFESTHGTEQLEEQISLFTKDIQQVCSKCIRRKRYKNTTKCTWWTGQLATMKKQVRAALRRFERCNGPNKPAYKMAYRRLLAKYKKTIKHSKRQSWLSFCSKSSTSDPFGLPYKLAKQKVLQPFKCATLLTQQNGNQSRFPSVEETLFQLINHHFKTDNSVTQNLECLKNELVETRNVDSEETSFSRSEIRNVIKSLNRGKAPGPDFLNIEIIQCLYQVLPEIICKMFNKCYSLHYFPVQWRLLQLVLFNKPNKQLNQLNAYRPICLLSTFSKIYDKLLSQRLLHFLLSNQFFSNNQYGFLPGRDATQAVFQLHNKILQNRQRNLYTSIISVDIGNAFNSINILKLLKLIIQLQCPPDIIMTYMSYFTNRKIRCKYQNKLLQKEYHWGCPQGSCSAPLFWNIIANSFLCLSNSNDIVLQAYADDFLIIVSAGTRQQLENTAKDFLERFDLWLQQWDLSLSVEKTAVLNINRKSTINNSVVRWRRQPIIRFRNHPLHNVSSFKYLGVHFTDNLTWLPHLKNLRTWSQDFALRLRAMTSSAGGLTPMALRSIYTASVQRKFAYAAGIWWSTPSLHMRRVAQAAQRIFLILITRCFRTTATCSLQIMTNCIPLDLYLDREKILQTVFQLKTPLSIDGQEYSPTSFEHKFEVALTHPASRITIPWTHFQESLLQTTGNFLFTDGSKTTEHTSGAFILVQNDHVTFKQTLLLQRGNSVFQAEAIAIHQALKYAQNINPSTNSNNIYVISDSQSVLHALMNPFHSSTIINDIKEVYHTLKTTGFTIKLMWTKGHAQSRYNNEVDTLARDFQYMNTHITPQKIDVKLPKSYLKSITLKNITNQWQNRWQSETKGRWTHNFFPKVNTDPPLYDYYVNQIITGHGCFPSYLCRFGFWEQETCPCGSQGTVLHYLTKCPLTQHLLGFSRRVFENSSLQSSWLTLPGIKPILTSIMEYLSQNVNNWNLHQ